MSAVEQPLPLDGLPEFEGVVPVGVLTKLTGSGQRIHRAMALGETGVLVVEYEVRNVGHKTTDDGVKRAHTLSVRDLWELPTERASELLIGLRNAYREASDALAGQEMFDIGDEVRTDPSGVVLTPTEWTDEQRADAAADRETTEELERARAGIRAVKEALAEAHHPSSEGFEPSDHPDYTAFVADYDSLRAMDAVARIRAMTDVDLVLAVAGWLEETGGRKTVISAARQQVQKLWEG